MIKTDILVVGSGAAGLVYAIKAAGKCPNKKITIITKSSPDESNTKYAQGGVAVVLDKMLDNHQAHIEDTMRAGDGLCNHKVVKMVVDAAPTRVLELVKWGVSFDLNEKGDYDLGREGGHSQNRVIHHKDNTGEAIEIVLLKKVNELGNIAILDYHLALDLLLSDDKRTCIGAEVLDINEKKVFNILSHMVVLATGGCGAVYEHTTNPLTSTGGGIALALRANAQVSNMQYMQFHPTAVYEEQKGKLALVSEAMRGAGAKLFNSKEETFMHKYDQRAELASRDIVSRAIHQEMAINDSNFVYLDCRPIAKDKLLNHFPNIYQECKTKGYDLLTDLLPVVPASHYLCGGIDVDMYGKTSVINLYAIGECSNTGLHGANRLASNSLLEALVYGHKAAQSTTVALSELSIDKAMRCAMQSNLIYSIEEEQSYIQDIKGELQSLMSRYVGIVRNTRELQLADEKCTELKERFLSKWNGTTINAELQELRDLLSVAQIMIKQSREQESNAGTFYNKDLDDNK